MGKGRFCRTATYAGEYSGEEFPFYQKGWEETGQDDDLR